jgi:hypothetical protein
MEMRWGVLVIATGCGFRGPLIGDAPLIDAPAVDIMDGPDNMPDAADDALADALLVDAMADAMADAMIDAPLVVDAPMCPATYALTIGTSRYRVIATDAVVGTQNTDCNDDQPGRTHLVALDSLGEMTALIPLLGPPPPSGQWFVGNFQKASQATTTAGWLLITGGALPAGLWAPGQPDDLGGATGEDNTQNISSIQSDGLHDNTATITGGGVCECDGKPPDPTVSALVP